MDGELGAPCLGTSLGTQAQQDGVLGDRAGWGRHGRPAGMAACAGTSLPQLPSRDLLGCEVLAYFSAVSWAAADSTHLKSPTLSFPSPTALLSAALPHGKGGRGLFSLCLLLPDGLLCHRLHHPGPP